MSFTTKNTLLLTGAGFTHNFGGYLARDMWSKIFNHSKVQARERVRGLLHSSFDFEAVYFDIISGDSFDAEDKSVIKEAVESAYRDLDETVRGWRFTMDNPLALNTYKLGELFTTFSGSGQEKGLIFTLNQDLLMERKNGHRPPGVQPFPDNFYHVGTPLEAKDFVRLPTEESMEVAKKTIEGYAGLVYIKLHGSYGWLSSDGESRMVIGKNKLEDIQQEPILSWYFQLFQEALFEGNKKLLIIGYGFRDEHINNILMKAVQEANLKLLILSPSDPEKFKREIEDLENGSILWNAVQAYFPYTLREVFPPDQSLTSQFGEIKRALSSCERS